MNDKNKTCGQCEDFTRYGDECFICSSESESLLEGCEVKFDKPACPWFEERHSLNIKFEEN